jgi:hypothetical protein
LLRSIEVDPARVIDVGGADVSDAQPASGKDFVTNGT